MKVAAGDFKTHCLQLIAQVHATGQEVLITKRGVAMAKLVAVNSAPPQSLFGAMKGSVAILGDLIAPIDEAWDAEIGG
ncbi:MAG: type II toxin-antitoxin system Phd/YefM family antitoxin [Sulfobacillus sp.]